MHLDGLLLTWNRTSSLVQQTMFLSFWMLFLLEERWVMF